jgi:hypothetical protein
MKKATLLTVMAIMAGIFFFQSCSKDEDTPVADEFIADDNSFKNFMNWPLEATNQGPDPALGTAHAGNDSTVIRRIYFANGQSAVNGKYPVGTMIVKHSSNPGGTVEEYTAMAKRGNGFNPTGGDWEWFMLNPDGSIATDGSSGMKMRGADLMNGMCAGCHAQATVKDFVFSK